MVSLLIIVIALRPTILVAVVAAIVVALVVVVVIVVEWRDESGELLYGAYYEYEIDAHRNWTHPVIWVWSRSLGERKVYETDSRTISYWPQ
jgi:hypothetical protein